MSVIRAYQITAVNATGETVSATIDTLSPKNAGINRQQAIMSLLDAVLVAKGTGWIVDYTISDIA